MAKKHDIKPAFRHSGNETHLMKELMLTTQKIIQTFGGNFGISGSSLVVLRAIAASGYGQAGVMGIALQLGIDAAAVTRMVQKLEKAGYVARKKGADRRESRLTLTAAGMARLKAAHSQVHDFEKKLERGLGKADIMTAVKVLRKVRDEFMKYGRGGKNGK